MNSRNPFSGTALVAAAVALLLTAGCGGETAESPVPDEQSSAQTELPPDHPPVDSPATGIAPPPPGSGQGTTGLTWEAPENWIPEAPSNAMRRAQYRVPGEAGDAECVIYYFGPGQGGDAVANAERWAGQFSQPDGSSSSDLMLFNNLVVEGIEVLLVEVTGIYNSALAMGGPTESFPDYMLLGAIAEGADANWFFKFTGPESTVRPERQAFDRMIRSLSPGG